MIELSLNSHLRIMGGAAVPAPASVSPQCNNRSIKIAYILQMPLVFCRIFAKTADIDVSCIRQQLGKKNGNAYICQ
ncbi:hypothetical protein EOE18_17170 [Novosphingobium umbonatum]|uniref:Uncharacterized protein n=1 Tax=Novosphingobium umbonatum TaxID=1908524 RepID=A0A437MXH0_9SPHN|nr:hypothetical protein [Novosphingobium umbonatum]RVU02347.1 hypothetical protein EOE18_17170 [Novosphingobium umbonatum]